MQLSPFLFPQYIMSKSEDTISRYLRPIDGLCTVPEGTLNLNKKYTRSRGILRYVQRAMLSASKEGIYFTSIAN